MKKRSGGRVLNGGQYITYQKGGQKGLILCSIEGGGWGGMHSVHLYTIGFVFNQLRKQNIHKIWIWLITLHSLKQFCKTVMESTKLLYTIGFMYVGWNLLNLFKYILFYHWNLKFELFLHSCWVEITNGHSMIQASSFYGINEWMYES